jgi:hypothetical protein
VDSDLRLLLGLFAEEDRLKVIAALVLDGPGDVVAVASRAGLDPRVAQRALSRLDAGGLAEEIDGRWQLRLEVVRAAIRDATPPRADDPGEGRDPSTASVLRAFVRDGRLVSMPAQRSKRRVILDHVARSFEIGVRYPEPQVDLILQTFHPDYAALRRYLVDEQFLSRENGLYWRTGGTVEL